ncbi:hypothetical protein Y032_0691g1567 [Ancylostoma ceylanicum]|uniref:Guanylate cyclase domain-containing protein n=1 Tax=Ancylostoma ceylanicum TaxID=53326 RepID=A0A016WGU5_9BILA|nr:hypothetical protein Y032_0691g1567 [Ancylostoma ceylanicum]
MFPSRTFFIALCFLTTTILSSRLCGVMLVHKLGKMCRITTEETCSKLNFEDVNIPIMGSNTYDLGNLNNASRPNTAFVWLFAEEVITIITKIIQQEYCIRKVTVGIRIAAGPERGKSMLRVRGSSRSHYDFAAATL